MEKLRSYLIYNDNILLIGDKIICLQIENGKENWSIDFLYEVQCYRYGFVIEDKLYIINRRSYETSKGIYWVYDIDNGEFLHQISDFFAYFPFNNVFLYPFYKSDKRLFICRGDRVYSSTEDLMFDINFVKNFITTYS